jgi:hypothetical protein
VRNTWLVQQAFGTVVWVVCAVGVIAGLAGVLFSRKTWEEYGSNDLVLDNDRSRAPASGSARERDTEIRQLLQARNELRRRRGEPSLDVEQELARLIAPEIDSELRAEIRDLVNARNHRRARAGQAPLDVDAEIAGLNGI